MSEGHVRTYDPSESAGFLKTKERFGGLSNMAPGFPIVLNGVRIRTSEALYQACRFPSRPDVQRQIIDDPSPMTAKMRSKPFRADTRPDWEKARVKIMRWCLRVKLAQNWETFGKLLLSTGDMPIVEKKVRRKDFWGATEQPDGTLIGMNVLGRLLMELREQLKSAEAEGLRLIKPLTIPEFVLFGRAIDVVEAPPEAHIPSHTDQHPPEKVLRTQNNSQKSLFDQSTIADTEHEPFTRLAENTKHDRKPMHATLYRDLDLSHPDIHELWNISLNDCMSAGPSRFESCDAMFREVELIYGEHISTIITKTIGEKLLADRSYQDTLKHVDIGSARTKHDKALERAVTELAHHHSELLLRLYANPSFRKWLSDYLFASNYQKHHTCDNSQA